MFGRRLGYYALVLMAAGCTLLPTAWMQLGQNGLTAGLDSIYDLGAAFDLPAVDSAPVGVVLLNRSRQDVEARVTMRVAGAQVHYSLRRLPAETDSMIIGPDRADSILVEGTLLADPPAALPMHTFFLGKDFQAGDIIPVLLADAEPDETEDGDGEREVPPTPPDGTLSVSIDRLNTDIVRNPGQATSFDVLTSGGSSAAVIAAFADPDDQPANANEVSIASGLPVADRTTVVWNTAGAAPGLYRVYAEIADMERFARSEPAPGRVRINAQPSMVLDSPLDGLLVMHGRSFIVSWGAYDSDDNATITVFFDRDGVADSGDEQVLRDGIAEDDTQDRELVVDTGGLELGVYYVGGRINDGFATALAQPRRVCITDRLAGRLFPTDDDFGPGELTTISGAAHNMALGFHLDVSRDLNRDRRADLLVSDPLAQQAGRQEEAVGELYYHRSGTWPRHLDTSQLTLRIIGEGQGTAVGARVALLPPIDNDPEGDILIGAPLFANGGPVGKAYLLNGWEVADLGALELEYAYEPLGGSITGDLHLPPGQLGLDVAALGDVDGDGQADYAVAASVLDWPDGPQPQIPGAGVVALVSGGGLPGNAWLSDIGCDLRGALAIGMMEGGMAGYAVRGVPGFGDGGADGLVIGAPAASPDGILGAGVVYLIRGPRELSSDCEGEGDFHLDEVGVSPDVPGHVFVGTSLAEVAGVSVASGDFDGDGNTDLLIGAPGYDFSRGRVYLIHNIAALPSGKGEIALGDVGGDIPGVVFEGVAVGDLTGWSVSTAGDFDDDGIEDILIGAPGCESLRGAAFLVYGGQGLSGVVSLAAIGTCDFAGLQLVGEEPGGQLGASVSGGGRLDGDNSSDVGIGAPGNGAVLGKAYMLFGPWSEPDDTGPQESPPGDETDPNDVQPIE